jgi:hypothetical protein
MVLEVESVVVETGFSLGLSSSTVVGLWRVFDLLLVLFPVSTDLATGVGRSSVAFGPVHSHP